MTTLADDADRDPLIELEKNELAQRHDLKRDACFDLAWDIAWDKGSSYGLYEVKSYFEELVGLLKVFYVLLDAAEKETQKVIDNYYTVMSCATFQRGDYVKKTKGAEWAGKIVGVYSTDLNVEGYAVESLFHKGSTQIYPATMLVRMTEQEVKQAKEVLLVWVG